jgi:hypothetical protein
MPNFIDKLDLRAREKADKLSETLRTDTRPEEVPLRELVRQNWHPLPEDLSRESHPHAALAVDGSIRQASLVNGAYLFVAQALCIGEGVEETLVDVGILRGSTKEGIVKRFSDLLLQFVEMRLGCQCINHLPDGGVMYLDGALYSRLPQLYPLRIEGRDDTYPQDTLQDFLYLFDQCNPRGRAVNLISIAKTSSEDTHSKIWQQAAGIKMALDLPDSEMIYRWARDEDRPVKGYSTPVILGTWGFSGGRRRLLQEADLGKAPAIIAFYVRLADFDDAIRVEVPACCLGDSRTLSELEAEVLNLSQYDVRPILEILDRDYAGLEIYNSLLYAVDREVRLRRQRMREIYLRVIESAVGYPIRLDRSERRF